MKRMDDSRDTIDEFSFMITCGALDAGYADATGKTFLMRALEVGAVAVAMKLGQKPKCNVNAQDCNGDTALIWGIKNHRANPVVVLLFDKRVDPALCNNAGESPMMLAIEHQQFTAVQQLVAAGVNPESPDPDFGTILDRAAARAFIHGDWSIENYLRQTIETRMQADLEKQIRTGMPSRGDVTLAPRIQVRKPKP
jgi:ankyrin repeat protein